MIFAGCPVYNRGWVLGKWFEAMERWVNPDEYVFVYTPSSDNTLEIIKAWERFKPVTLIHYAKGTHGIDRDWTNRARIETLADMRNLMLDWVAHYHQDHGRLASVDSDVILQGRGFLYHALEWDVFGPTVALAADRTIINGFSHRRADGWTVRAQPGHHGRVDVLCATQFMNADVVKNVRYGYHPRGEDFYFAQQVREHGFAMGLCTEVAAHHMTPGRPPIFAVDNDPRLSTHRG